MLLFESCHKSLVFSKLNTIYWKFIRSIIMVAYSKVKNIENDMDTLDIKVHYIYHGISFLKAPTIIYLCIPVHTRMTKNNFIF